MLAGDTKVPRAQASSAVSAGAQFPGQGSNALLLHPSQTRGLSLNLGSIVWEAQIQVTGVGHL